MSSSSDFAALTESSKYLNKQSDSFHSTLVNIQYKIVKLGIGITVWLDDPQDLNGCIDGTHGWTLGLTKHDGAWCLAIHGIQVVNTPEGRRVMRLGGESTPLLEAPRGQRIAALKLIPALVKRLKIEADRVSSVMDEALKQAQALDATL